MAPNWFRIFIENELDLSGLVNLDEMIEKANTFTDYYASLDTEDLEGMMHPLELHLAELMERTDPRRAVMIALLVLGEFNDE